MQAYLFISRKGDRLDLLLNLGCLTNAIANVVKLSTSNLTDTNDVDLLHIGRVDGERLLHAATVRNSSDGKGLGDAAAVLGDYGSFEHLDSLTRTLLDLVVNTNGVTDADHRNVFLKLLTCKSLDHIHLLALLKYRTFMQSIAADCSLIHRCKMHTVFVLYHNSR